MNVAAWPRDRQVDWLAVRSRLDQQAFILRLQRPWARDPGFYVDRMLRVTFTDLPVAGDARDTLLARLRAILRRRGPVLPLRAAAAEGITGTGPTTVASQPAAIVASTTVRSGSPSSDSSPGRPTRSPGPGRSAAAALSSTRRTDSNALSGPS